MQYALLPDILPSFIFGLDQSRELGLNDTGYSLRVHLCCQLILMLFVKLAVTKGRDAIACLHTVTGGCGSMYEVHIMAEEFRDVRTVMQHRMVNEVQ